MNATNVQMGEWLGLPVPAAETEMLRIVEGKLAATVIKRLISLGLQRAEIDAAIIPLRTLQHRRSRREKLTVEESGPRAARDSGTFAGGIRIRKPGTRISLAAEPPSADGGAARRFRLLNTDTGSRIVEELLVQIDEGMFV